MEAPVRKTLGGPATGIRKDHQSKTSILSKLWATRPRLPQSYESIRLEREKPSSPGSHRPNTASDGAAWTVGRNLRRSTEALSPPSPSSPTLRWASSRASHEEGPAKPAERRGQATSTSPRARSRTAPVIILQPSSSVEASGHVYTPPGSESFSFSVSGLGSSGVSPLASPVRRRAARSFQEGLANMFRLSSWDEPSNARTEPPPAPCRSETSTSGKAHRTSLTHSHSAPDSEGQELRRARPEQVPCARRAPERNHSPGDAVVELWRTPSDPSDGTTPKAIAPFTRSDTPTWTVPRTPPSHGAASWHGRAGAAWPGITEEDSGDLAWSGSTASSMASSVQAVPGVEVGEFRRTRSDATVGAVSRRRGVKSESDFNGSNVPCFSSELKVGARHSLVDRGGGIAEEESALDGERGPSWEDEEGGGERTREPSWEEEQAGGGERMRGGCGWKGGTLSLDASLFAASSLATRDEDSPGGAPPPPFAAPTLSCLARGSPPVLRRQGSMVAMAMAEQLFEDLLRGHWDEAEDRLMMADVMEPEGRAFVLSYTSPDDGATLLHAAVAPKPELRDFSAMARRDFSRSFILAAAHRQKQYLERMTSTCEHLIRLGAPPLSTRNAAAQTVLDLAPTPALAGALRACVTTMEQETMEHERLAAMLEPSSPLPPLASPPETPRGGRSAPTPPSPSLSALLRRRSSLALFIKNALPPSPMPRVPIRRPSSLALLRTPSSSSIPESPESASTGPDTPKTLVAGLAFPEVEGGGRFPIRS